MEAVELALEVSFDWVSVIFLDEKPHTELNIKHLNHNYSTDILTFQFSDGENKGGEIYINVDQARINAQDYNVSHLNELSRLIAHGLLHLAGIGDKTDAEQKEMTDFENKILEETKSFHVKQ